MAIMLAFMILEQKPLSGWLSWQLVFRSKLVAMLVLILDVTMIVKSHQGAQVQPKPNGKDCERCECSSQPQKVCRTLRVSVRKKFVLNTQETSSA